MIAKAIKKTFSDTGTREPSNDKTPMENAISVAEGIAHPLRVPYSFMLINTYINVRIFRVYWWRCIR